MNLSRKGWNNVLIFAVLGMIFIFNFSHKLMMEPKSFKTDSSSILPEHTMVLSMEAPDYIIERVGRSWRSKPAIGLQPEQLAKVIYHWSTMSLPLYKAEVGQLPVSQFSQKYIFWLAGVEEPMTITLYQLEQGFIIANWREQLLLLDEASLASLLPK